MKLRSAAAAAAGLLFFAFTALAQVTAVEGIVKGVDGKPVVGAVIKIHRTDMKWDSQTKTDKKGHYFHTGLPISGTFTVSVEVDGKQVDSVSGVQPRPGDPLPVNFDLKSNQQSNSANQAEMQKAIETGLISDELKRRMTPEQKAQLQKQIDAQAASMKKRNELNSAFNDGMEALKAKQYDQAVAALTKAAEVDPTQAAVWANLGDAYMGQASTKTGPEYDALTQKGLDSYAKALELKPDDAAAHNNYALALAKAKKIPEMQAELKKSAELDPAGAYRSYYNLGALMTNAGQLEAAAEAFKMAIQSAPNEPRNAEAYYQYGVILMGKATVAADGKISPEPGTTEAFQKYLELAPGGTHAEEAKAMLASLGSAVETKFTDPNAKKAPPPKKKK
ncbi:MAG: carboxypeptidase regulatory-like domain-containing protein [Acidobacteriia bacterium]|nr:carboxypeptidase regulatory-like domain-containing protein [Terriglobia bacterium]